MGPRYLWASPMENYQPSGGVVDREPPVYYRGSGCPDCLGTPSTDPSGTRFQRDIPQASSSSRRQCKLRLMLALISFKLTFQVGLVYAYLVPVLFW